MNTRFPLKTLSRHWLPVLAILACSGCIVLPVPVEAEIEQLDEVSISDEILISDGSRDLLQTLTEKLIDKRHDIEVVDAAAFRNTAFPDGGWRLNDLLQYDAASRAVDETNVAHLVMVSIHDTDTWDEGFSLMAPLAFGALSAEDKIAMSVMIIDLRQPQIMAETVVTATGHTRGAFLAVYGLFLVPMTASAVHKGIVDAIVQGVPPVPGNDTVRIALLATESAVDIPKSVADGQFPEPSR